MKIIMFCISILLAYHHAKAQSLSDTTQAHQLSSLAFQQQSKGALKLSIQNFAQASAIYQQNSIWKKYLECQNQIARNYWRMNKLDSSMAISQAVLSHPQLEEKSLEQAEAFSNAGVVCDKRTDFAKAIQYFQKCLAIRKAKLGEEHTETGKVYFNIGSCNSLQKKWVLH